MMAIISVTNDVAAQQRAQCQVTREKATDRRYIWVWTNLALSRLHIWPREKIPILAFPIYN